MKLYKPARNSMHIRNLLMKTDVVRIQTNNYDSIVQIGSYKSYNINYYHLLGTVAVSLDDVVYTNELKTSGDRVILESNNMFNCFYVKFVFKKS